MAAPKVHIAFYHLETLLHEAKSSDLLAPSKGEIITAKLPNYEAISFTVTEVKYEYKYLNQMKAWVRAEATETLSPDSQPD